MPILFDKQRHIKDILEPKESQKQEKEEIISVEIPESEARKRVNDFVIRIQNSTNIFNSARLSFMEQPGLMLFLRNPTNALCRRLLMRFDLWYNYLSSKRFETDRYFSETKITGRRAHRCQFYCNVFKVEDRPSLVFCEQNREPLNYIVIPSAALKILMRGGRETRLFAVLDFLDILWFSGFSPFQMTENTIRDLLTWVSVGRASRKKPKDLRKKHGKLWRSFRINRVPFSEGESGGNGGPTVK